MLPECANSSTKSEALKKKLLVCRTFYTFLPEGCVPENRLWMSISTETKQVCRRVWAIKTNVQSCNGLWRVASLPLGDDIYIAHTHTPPKPGALPDMRGIMAPLKRTVHPQPPSPSPCTANSDSAQTLPDVTDGNIFNAEV